MRLKELVIDRDAKPPKVMEEPLKPINVKEIIRRWNKPMMKHEFDALVGIDTDPECYKKIEAVYMQFDEMFPTKEAIASFYKKHDMNGIERMYREALKIQQLEQQLKALQCPVIVTKPAPENEAAFKELLDVLNKHGWCKPKPVMDEEMAYDFLMKLNDWDIFGEIRRDGFAYNYDDVEERFSECNLETGKVSDENLTPLQLYLKLFSVPVPVKPTEGNYKYEFPKWSSQYQQEPITQLAFSATQLDTLIRGLGDEFVCPHNIGLKDSTSGCADNGCEKCWRAALKEVEVKK